MSRREVIEQLIEIRTDKLKDSTEYLFRILDEVYIPFDIDSNKLIYEGEIIYLENKKFVINDKFIRKGVSRRRTNAVNEQIEDWRNIISDLEENIESLQNKLDSIL